MKVCLASTYQSWNTTLGGHAWVGLNWALGLKAKGCEVILLEKLRGPEKPEKLLGNLQRFRRRLGDLGLSAGISLVLSPAQQERLVPIEKELLELTVPIEEAFAQTELFLNSNYAIPAEVIRRFRRSALIDIDPGLLQMWVSRGQMQLYEHDIYFSIGETVGQPGARFSDCGVRWHYTPPPVYLPAWPVTPAPKDAPYSTVTNWWGEFEVDDEGTYNNEKRTHFIDCLDLPTRIHAPLELAIYHEPGHDSDMPMLREHGWRARPASEVSGTPEQYRRYIQNSRGEFSCAKPSCMRYENAWISDRSICYLASGKPVVVQHTGKSSFLPDAAGIFRFRSMQEAVDAFASLESDYGSHCKLARVVAEEYFDAEKVVGGLLERAMDVKPTKNPAHG